ncbi:magnesium transporter MRS2-3 isoform X1 [Brassica napus]|uniref:magnesium transporter MRS2-3 isoform X1 n=1 Tax=Brassica napus TaxID=3708 RepID=UPI00207967DE|nr:magnesium transporter MRS2-3 isoform X1 [Brassica napus]
MRGPRPEDFETNPSTPITGQPTPTYPAGARKKGVGVRTWLVLCARGQAQTTEVGKHAIMRRTGLPARDLRILDPLLSYPSTVLGRERAIVINLEHIKAIITAQEVLLLNSKDPSVAPFIDELQRRILCHYRATKPKEEENYEGETRMSMDQPQGGGDGTPLLFGEQGDEAKKDAKQSLENQDGSKVLPFEFVALEACLEAASSSLESEAVRLELEAHPALDKLTSKISTLNLERVRQIKSRLVAITGRVQKVRDELEHLLDDDEDMAEMYLTEKLAQKLENSSASSMNESDTVEVDLPEGDEDDRLPAESASESNRDESYLRANDDAHDLLMSTHSALSRNSRGTHTSSTRSAMTNKFDVEELEMLLEAYFVQIDGDNCAVVLFEWGKKKLREYVDDTEDYINIMLDDKQNHLLQMGVMLTTATLVMSAFIAVAGVFGMNITIELFKDEKAGPTRFAWTVIGGFIGSIFLYVGAIGWWKQKRLLE